MNEAAIFQLQKLVMDLQKRLERLEADEAAQDGELEDLTKRIEDLENR